MPVFSLLVPKRDGRACLQLALQLSWWELKFWGALKLLSRRLTSGVKGHVSVSLACFALVLCCMLPAVVLSVATVLQNQIKDVIAFFGS